MQNFFAFNSQKYALNTAKKNQQTLDYYFQSLVKYLEMFVFFNCNNSFLICEKRKTFFSITFSYSLVPFTYSISLVIHILNPILPLLIMSKTYETLVNCPHCELHLRILFGKQYLEQLIIFSPQNRLISLIKGYIKFICEIIMNFCKYFDFKSLFQTLASSVKLWTLNLKLFLNS